MLAGRKLLLADDSVTIQKVIDLTFADEGVEVITVGDGQKAIEKVEQLLPDVVLADVFMPTFNGYEVCEYIKTSEKLKHIPVMLLVGSFEPFDEAEARRVGANDILTKPFQSIRRLIEKVGELVSSKPPGSEVPTAELPGQEKPEQPKLSTAELEVVTADTLQLPAELAHQAHQIRADNHTVRPVLGENKMDSQSRQAQETAFTENDDTLLDLGDFEPADTLAADDFELELDLDEPERVPAPMAYSTAFDEPQVTAAQAVAGWEAPARDHLEHNQAVMNAEPLQAEVLAEEARFEQQDYRARGRSGALDSRMAPAPLTVENFPPELIEAIARKAVEYLSEKVVQEIAWEVVPQLAELIIKRQLEEKESQHK